MFLMATPLHMPVPLPAMSSLRPPGLPDPHRGFQWQLTLPFLHDASPNHRPPAEFMALSLLHFSCVLHVFLLLLLFFTVHWYLFVYMSLLVPVWAPSVHQCLEQRGFKKVLNELFKGKSSSSPSC